MTRRNLIPLLAAVMMVVFGVSSAAQAEAPTISGSKPKGQQGPAETTSLNSSRSNIYRKGQTGEPKGQQGPAETTSLNSSRSNIYRKGQTTQPSGSGPAKTTIRGSNSN